MTHSANPASLMHPMNKPSPHEDPVVRSARREAAVSMAVWLAAMTYTVGYSWMFGYGRPPEEVQLIGGVPDWVLWGIVAPWAVCVAISAWFAYGYMTDEPLGAEEVEDGESQI